MKWFKNISLKILTMPIMLLFVILIVINSLYLHLTHPYKKFILRRGLSREYGIVTNKYVGAPRMGELTYYFAVYCEKSKQYKEFTLNLSPSLYDKFDVGDSLNFFSIFGDMIYALNEDGKKLAEEELRNYNLEWCGE